MLKLVKTATLSAMIGLGAMAAAPASADSVAVHFAAQDAAFGFYFGESGGPGWGRGYGYDRHDWRYRPYRDNYCSMPDALRKAARIGVHHPRVRYTTYRTITVSGYSRGYPTHVIFGRAGNCPILR